MARRLPPRVNNVHLRTPTLQNVKEAYLAAKTYNQTYPGHVTVFRATDRLLMHTIAPEVTGSAWLWGRYGYDVPGGHLSMLTNHMSIVRGKTRRACSIQESAYSYLLSTSNLSPAEHLLSLI
jgi:hypothetical protein